MGGDQSATMCLDYSEVHNSMHRLQARKSEAVAWQHVYKLAPEYASVSARSVGTPSLSFRSNILPASCTSLILTLYAAWATDGPKTVPSIQRQDETISCVCYYVSWQAWHHSAVYCTIRGRNKPHSYCQVETYL